MLLFTKQSALDLAHALQDAAEALDTRDEFDAVTIEKIGSRFVCVDDDVITDSTCITVARDTMDRDKPRLRSVG
jgi:hypothetical protein